MAFALDRQTARFELAVQAEAGDHRDDVADLVVEHERDADAGGAGARRAADAVDVVLGRGGRVVVDDVRHVAHVDPARGDVGRDERVDAARLELRERALALALRLVAVHRRDVERRDAAELLREPVGAALRAHEHERAPALLLGQLGDELVGAALARDLQEAVLDLAARLLRRRVRVASRLVRVHARDAVDLAGERRGEEHRLAVVGRQRDEPVDDRAEAHVEHAVGLVEHEHARRSPSETALRSSRSTRRPGVATSTSALRAACICGLMPAPP